MWLREELTTDDDIMNKEFKSKVTVNSVGINSAGIYKEDILNGADPVLAENLIPVTIDEKGKVTRADTNKKWYNYANQEWANAVILEDDYEDPGAGKEIPEDKIESYFVWIPRYKYKIWDEGKYNSLTTIENKVQTIQVVFETKEDKVSKGNTINSWLTHPAFTSFNVNGLWVAKFETGYRSATKTTETGGNPESEEDAFSKVSEVIIKPNVYSWRNIQVAKAYVVSYNYERDLDSHMMKNTEWGAVAYLSQSLYGSRKNPRINNNQSYLTGYAAKNEPTTGYTASNELCSNNKEACNEYGTSEKGKDSNYSYNYFNPLSVVASTTGNYTGIYDMSGGAREMMMSGISDGIDSQKLSAGRHNKYNSGFNGTLTCPQCTDASDSNIKQVTNGINLPTETKYYDIYKYNNNVSDFTNFIYGDATSELGPFQSVKYKGTIPNAQEQTRQISSWYNNAAHEALHTNPYITRGGNYDYGSECGLFNFMGHDGNNGNNRTFRIVLALPEE